MTDISRISYSYFLMHYIKGNKSKIVKWHKQIKNNNKLPRQFLFLETAVKEKFKEYKGCGQIAFVLDF